jgi:hypothetical protein
MQQKPISAISTGHVVAGVHARTVVAKS